MAKIKVKLRRSKVDGKAGTIYYYVSHKKIIRHITTNIHILPEHWDEDNQRIVSAGNDTERMQNRIDSDMAVLHGIIDDLDMHRQYTADDIVDRFRAPERHISVLSFFQQQMQLLIDCDKWSTATNYLRVASTLFAFLEGRDLCFSEMTTQFVEQYNDYLLRKGLVRNSLSFHMRILRALYNKAVRRGYAEQTFPFRDVYTGVDRTKKRAVGEGVISRLIHLELEDKPSMAFARDLFVFSFYTRGMAFVDMAYLRKSDIRNGIIYYVRRKTGQELSVRIEPCIRNIIDKYAARTDASPYVFPILRNEKPAECFRRYKTELRLFNSRLTQLSQLLDLEHNISSYTSRHSWATMARNHNIPLSVISAGMGHTSERTTQIYLTSLENSLIDNANKGLLEILTKPTLSKKRIKFISN